MLDVNAGIPLADEPALLARAVKLVQSVTDVPLSIDSSIVAALEAGLAVYEGKALVNSVTGEEESDSNRFFPDQEARRGGWWRSRTTRPDLRRSRRQVRGREKDRGTGRGSRYPAFRHRRRSPGDADRGDQPGRPAGHSHPQTPARGAEGQFDLRSLEHQLRPAESQRYQQHLSVDGDHRGYDPRRSRIPCTATSSRPASPRTS